MADGTGVIELDLDITARANPPKGNDELTLVIGRKEWSGWQKVVVTRGIDTVPAVFDLDVTDQNSPTGGNIDIKPGEPCQVKIGGELVITGYVDRYTADLAPRAHTVRITGRSKSSDLVDCAAFFGSRDNEGYQTLGGSTLSIAKQLAEPYDVNVQSTAGDGKQIKQFNIIFGETPWEIIDRITRYSNMIVYDMPDGSIMLAQAGSGGSMTGGFGQGRNVESAGIMLSMDQRFSLYEGFAISSGVFTTQSAQSGGTGQKPEAVERDENVPRFRKRIIVSEQMTPEGPLIKDRVRWEKNRRIGRSTALTVTADSWRDSSGKLWAPNAMAAITMPALKVANATWCIGQVTFVRDENGQHAQVMLMPKEAFTPQPDVLLPLPVTLQDRGVAPANPTAREGHQ